MDHMATLVYTHPMCLALGPRFGVFLGPQAQGFGSRGSRSGQILEILYILGGAGDIYNSISMLNYCNGPYGDLSIYTTEDPSAWTEVWSIPWPSSARYWLPGGRSGQIARFLRSLEGPLIYITR